MKNRPLCSLCLFFCLLICIGTVLGGGKLIKELSPSAAELYLKEDEEILAAGRVYQKADIFRHVLWAWGYVGPGRYTVSTLNC